MHFFSCDQSILKPIILLVLYILPNAYYLRKYKQNMLFCKPNNKTYIIWYPIISQTFFFTFYPKNLIWKFLGICKPASFCFFYLHNERVVPVENQILSFLLFSVNVFLNLFGLGKQPLGKMSRRVVLLKLGSEWRIEGTYPYIIYGMGI